MDKAANIFYHLGWIIGVGWLILAIGQIFLGLQGQATTDVAGWGAYVWLGVSQVVLGFGWLLWWFFSFRHRLQSKAVR